MNAPFHIQLLHTPAIRPQPLTSRERDVLGRILLGHSSRHIAQELCISHRTLEAHRARILRKFKVKSLIELLLRLISTPTLLEEALGPLWRQTLRHLTTSQGGSRQFADRIDICLSAQTSVERRGHIVQSHHTNDIVIHKAEHTACRSVGNLQHDP